MRRAAAAGSSRPGVYLRHGRWAVDFRDHRRNIRQWLGTYSSKEEATAAYDAFEVQVHASLSRGERPPAPDARGGRGRVKIQEPARRASGRRKKQQPEDLTTAKTKESSQARTSSASLSSLASAVEDLPGPSSSSSSERMRRAAAAGSSRPGVYLRHGRWAVDFRDHWRNIRQWLGTYSSKEEATAAYDAFEVQVNASLSRGELPPAPDARGGRGRVKIQEPARRASGRRKKQKPEDLTTVKTKESSQARTSSASLSSLASAVEASAVTPQINPRPLVVDPFLALEDQFAGDDHFGFGLADLGHLPLPFLDGNIDFKLSESDLSLFDVGFM